MSHIFISYSHLDKAYAHKLHRHLIDRGFDAWIDDRIDYGSHWPREIEKRLNECLAFILIISPSSYESEWVQNELSLARQLHKPIFPLLLDGDVWWHLQTTQYVDVKGGKLPPTRFFVQLAEVAPCDHDYDSSEDAEDELEEPKSQAIQFELLGKFSDALRVYYQIKRVDPLFPGIDNKIKQLEYETHPKRFLERPESEVAKKPAHPLNLGIITGVIGALIVIGFSIWAGILFIKIFPASTPQPAQTPVLSAPTLGIGSSMISPKDGMKLLYVPAGNFLMGSTDSDPNANSDEKPQHTVYLDAFWIDQTDVTNKMYALCVSAAACTSPSNTSSVTHPSYYYGNSEFDNYPVIYVSWDDATAYCIWAGRQLPTEAQWEKAARGTDGRIYPWGNTAPDHTLLNYNSSDTTAVGSYPKGASPYSPLDMAGNVWQWVADSYNAYPGNTMNNPHYGTTYRVLRGGSWNNYINIVRSAYRDWYPPTYFSDYVGFRCAASATAPITP